MFRSIVFGILLCCQLHAKLNVLTTTPDLLWLVDEIGGERVTASSLLVGTEDPHFVDAMPSWIARVSNADVFCLVGMDLEVGWVPKVLNRASNEKVMPGGKGYCDVGRSVKALEVPTGKIDRSMGDVHAAGNPHYHLGPDYFQMAAAGVFDALVNNDPEGTAVYLKNFETLKVRLQEIEKRVMKAVPKGVKIMAYHREFSYFVKNFQIEYVGDIEEVPGVPPSAGRIARSALLAKRKGVDTVLASPHSPDKLLKRFREMSGVGYQKVPVSMGRVEGLPKNYEDLLMAIAKALGGTQK